MLNISLEFYSYALYSLLINSARACIIIQSLKWRDLPVYLITVEWSLNYTRCRKT